MTEVLKKYDRSFIKTPHQFLKRFELSPSNFLFNFLFFTIVTLSLNNPSGFVFFLIKFFVLAPQSAIKNHFLQNHNSFCSPNSIQRKRRKNWRKLKKLLPFKKRERKVAFSR
jgi:hypothetical protein